MLKGLNDFMDKVEGREKNKYFRSSTKAIKNEFKRQGYGKALEKKKGNNLFENVERTIKRIKNNPIDSRYD